MPTTNHQRIAGVLRLAIGRGSTSASPRSASRPEDVLLLICAGVRTDELATAELERLLRGEIDWSYLLQAAHQHRLVPLLYSRLSTDRSETVPDAVRRYLRLRAHIEALRSQSSVTELLRLLELFSDNDVPAIPFKGPVLAASLYGEVALRPFVDLDLLVPEKDIVAVCALLQAEGYRPVIESTPGGTIGHVLGSIRKKDIALRHFEKQILLELHWALFPKELSLFFDSGHVWKSAQYVSLNGSLVRTLAPEDLLLYLCIHGAKHGWPSLIWIRDVAELLRSEPGIDWSRVFGQAGSLRAVRVLYLGLLLATELLGAPLPDDVAERVLRDRRARSLAGRVRRRLFSYQDGMTKRVWPRIFWLRARDSRRDGVLALLYYLFVPTPAERARHPLPRPLSFLHFVAHPAWVALNMLRDGLRRYRQGRAT